MLEHDRKEPSRAGGDKGQPEQQVKSTPVATSAAARVHGDSAPEVMNENMIPNSNDEDEDDGHFDIDDISANAMPPTAVLDTERQPQAPLVYSPSGEARTTAERHTGAPILRPPSHTSFPLEHVPRSPNEHDVSHSSANHLRQYATYPRNGNNGGSSRERTPRDSDTGRRTPTGTTSISDSARTRTRNSIRRSHRVHGKSGAERVKAFVVFGADSSDLDTGTSEEESDDTTVRSNRDV